MIDIRIIYIIYLWLLFGMLTSFINCKLINLLKNNIYLQYIVLYFSILFLFITFEFEKNEHIFHYLKYAFYILILLILLIKTNKYISLFILFLLLIDGFIKLHINYLSTNNKDFQQYEKIREINQYIFIISLVIGFIFIVYKYKKKFSLKKFLSNNC